MEKESDKNKAIKDSKEKLLYYIELLNNYNANLSENIKKSNILNSLYTVSSGLSLFAGGCVAALNDKFLDKSVQYKMKVEDMEYEKNKVENLVEELNQAYTKLSEKEDIEEEIKQFQFVKTINNPVQEVEYEDSYTDELAVGFSFKQYCQQNCPRRVLVPKSK